MGLEPPGLLVLAITFGLMPGVMLWGSGLWHKVPLVLGVAGIVGAIAWWWLSGY